MRKQLQPGIMMPVAIVLMLAVLLFNSVILARTAGYIQFPGEMSKLEIVKQGAGVMVDYYERLAAEASVIDRSAVREVIAKFKYELDRAATPEEVAQLESTYGRQIQDVIYREHENKLRETVQAIINQDPNLANYPGQGTITVTTSEADGIRIEDNTGYLTGQTIEAVRNHELLNRAGSTIVIELSVADGKAGLVTARTLLDRLKMYESEVSNLKAKIQELNMQAGYAELTGSGIVVELYDAEEGLSTVDIVHDRDVRELVNELFAAGAKGVAVGGQRLIATSSIRCAGPVILVDQKPIAVNPIVVNAVGDPEVLASSLDLLRSQLEEYGIVINISKDQPVTLPPYQDKK